MDTDTSGSLLYLVEVVIQNSLMCLSMQLICLLLMWRLIMEEVTRSSLVRQYQSVQLQRDSNSGLLIPPCLQVFRSTVIMEILLELLAHPLNWVLRSMEYLLDVLKLVLHCISDL